MTLIESETCPCGSGFARIQCCGVPEKTAANAAILARITPDTPTDVAGLTPQLQNALQQIDNTPDLFPLRINLLENRNYFVKMSPQWYRESTFLDPQRILGSCVIETDNAFIEEKSDVIKWQPTGFIFHTAFCGSTLVSQALSQLYNSLALREPEILGNILYYLQLPDYSEANKFIWLERILRLLSRRYNSAQKVLVKANDHSNALMKALLQSQYPVPLLFMYTNLSEFVMACLKAENRRQWISGRYRSISAYAPTLLSRYPVDPLSKHEYSKMAALYWCYNIALYQEAWAISESRVRSLNFASVLASPQVSINACAEFLQLQNLTNIDVKHEITGLFAVYSKNSKIDYSPEHRQKELDLLCQKYSKDLIVAEQLARRVLGQQFPDTNLPGNLC